MSETFTDEIYITGDENHLKLIILSQNSVIKKD